MTLNKFGTFAGAALLAGFSWANAVQAGPFTEADVFDGSGGLLAGAVDELDWSSFGRGLAIGVGPFGTPLTVGQEFDFKYQAYLNGFVGADPGSVAPTLLGDGAGGGEGGGFSGDEYEFTIVATFREVVTNVIDLGGGDFLAVFGLAAPGGKVSIFYDDASAGGSIADNDAGTGFDDGTEVARFSIVDNFSTFTADTGDGTGDGQAEIIGLVSSVADFVNPDFFVGIEGKIFDLELDGTLEFPPLTDPDGFHIGGSADYPNITPTDNDIIFQADSNSTFSIPEPQTLLLFGLALLMLGAVGVGGRMRAAP